MLSRSVLFAYLNRRVVPHTVVLVAAASMAFSVLTTATLRDSAVAAGADSVRGDLGNRAYVIQTGDPQAARALAMWSPAAPVQDGTGNLVAGGLAAQVLVRTTTDPSLQLGAVVAGRHPTIPGEVLLARPVAEALGVSLGDQVRLSQEGTPSTNTVVGLTIDPADNVSNVLTRLARSTTRPNRWLADQDPYDVPTLRPYFDSRAATYRSSASLVAATRENRPEFLTALSRLPLGMWLLLVSVLVAVLAARVRQWRQDVLSLIAAGMSPRGAWAHVAAVSTVVVLAGELLGALMAAWTMSAGRVSISGWLGQHWLGVQVPWTYLVPLLIGTMTVPFIALKGLSRAGPVVAPTPSPRRANRRAALAAAVFIVTALAWTVLMVRATGSANRGDDTYRAILLAAVIAAATSPYGFAPILRMNVPRATRALLRSLHNSVLASTAGAALVIATCTIYVAQNVYDANLGERIDNPIVPAGSFAISEVPNSVLPTLTRLFADQGARQMISYEIADERVARWRVTGASVVSCLRSARQRDPGLLPDSCWPADTASPLNSVGIGPTGSKVRADPGLLQEGVVGLLEFRGTDPAAYEMQMIRAQPDPTLGGFLPGLVLPRGSTLARSLDLRSVGKSQVALLDFADLAPSQRFYVRAAAMRIAPGGDTADGTNPTIYDRLRTVATTVGVLGALLAGLVLLVGGAATVLSSGAARNAVVDLGASPNARWRLYWLWAALPLLTVANTVVLAYASVSVMGQRDQADYGLTWLLPGLMGLVGSVVVGAAMLRVPERSIE